ncbi:MAG: hypothetical protein WAU02_03810 [Candidatus Saccharimonadales bacterium]
MKRKRIVIIGGVLVGVGVLAALAWFVVSRPHGTSQTSTATLQLQSTDARTYVEAADEYETGSADWTDIMLNAAVDAAEKGKCSDARSIYSLVGQHIHEDARQAYDDLKPRIQKCAS